MKADDERPPSFMSQMRKVRNKPRRSCIVRYLRFTQALPAVFRSTVVSRSTMPLTYKVLSWESRSPIADREQNFASRKVMKNAENGSQTLENDFQR